MGGTRYQRAAIRISNCRASSRNRLQPCVETSEGEWHPYPPFSDWQEWVPFRRPYLLARQIIITRYTKPTGRRSAQTKRMVEVLVKGGADRSSVVALLAIEQAVPDKGVDLAIADFDHQAAQAATPAFAMQTHAVGGRFLDGIDLSHWSANHNDNRGAINPL